MTEDAPKKAAIAHLNDRLRRNHIGGQVMITRGLSDLPADQLGAVIEAVRQFEAFTPDNDPWGEHDCATLNVAEHQVIFKIDYFEHNLQFASADPSDPSITTRILTIMLAEEY